MTITGCMMVSLQLDSKSAIIFLVLMNFVTGIGSQLTNERENPPHENQLNRRLTNRNDPEVIRRVGVPTGTPRNIDIVAISSSVISLSWEPPVPQRQNGILTGYKIRYRPEGPTVHTVLNVNAPDLSVEITGLLSETVYEFRLAASTINGTGPYSPRRQLRTPQEEPELQLPGIPSSLSIESFVNYVIVRWSPPLEDGAIIEGYLLGYGRNVPDEYILHLEANERSDNVTSLISNTNYVFKFRAFNRIGEGGSLYETITTLPEPIEMIPLAPVTFSVDLASVSYLILSWTVPEDISILIKGYILGYGTVSPDEFVANIDGKESSYNITDLEPDSEYVLSLRAYNNAGDTGPFLSTVARTLPEPIIITIPPSPILLFLEPSIHSVLATWTLLSIEGSSVDGYKISYGISTPDVYTVDIEEASTTTYNVTSLLSNTHYVFKLVAYNTAGDSIPTFSNVSTLPDPIELTVPQTQSFVSFNASTYSVLVTWTLPSLDSSVVDGYTLSYGIRTPDDYTVYIEEASTTSYNVTILSPNTYYIFKLTAYNTVGDSIPTFSNVSTLPEPVKLTVPQTQSFASFNASTYSVLVTWTLPLLDSSVVDGYRLSYGISTPDDYTVHIEEAGTTYYNITSLLPNTHYVFKLTAYNTVGDSIPTFSNVSTLPEPVTVLSCPDDNWGCSDGCVPVGKDSYECTCQEGYQLNSSLKICSDIDECLDNSNVCDSPSIVCTNYPGSFACECAPGHHAYNDIMGLCEDLDECEDNPYICGSTATCVNTFGSYECPCNTGYIYTNNRGLNSGSCVDIDECLDNPNICNSPSLVCANYPGSFVCECAPGYRANNGALALCEDVDECEDNPFTCGSTATCVNTFGSYECPCNTGYIYSDNTGSSNNSCVDADECEFAFLLPIICGPHATCENLPGSFECDCVAGYTNDSGLCFDLNECESGDPCGASGICENLDGSFRCECRQGYTTVGNICEDIDECSLTGVEKVCSETMLCINFEGAYHCFCPPGFHSNGTYCSDVNECGTNTHGCDENALCGNLVGSYYCQCLSGYIGDGTTCFDVNECDISNGGCPHRCVNVKGSFHCECYEGFRQPDTYNQLCEDIDECQNSDICSQHCDNTFGSYNCRCDDGFILHINGHICVDINECMLTNDCEELCLNTLGGYTCECGPTRVLIPDDNTHCKDIVNCEEKNGGCAHRCRFDQRGIICSCEGGWLLDENKKGCIDVNECLIANGGCEQICHNTEGAYHCSCRNGYRPRQDNRYQCISSCNPPCMNYGVCTGPDICVCPAGYGGATCQPTCNPPCAHGGTCRRHNMCQCRIGYSGSSCERAVCTLPCMNGGYCIGPEQCQCPAIFTGNRCQTPKCAPDCRNGGTCVTTNTCICPTGFFGARCQHEKSMCSLNYCKHGGTCSGVNRCQCTESYYGRRCNNRLPNTCVPPCYQGGKCISNNVCSCPRGVGGARCQLRTCAIESYQFTKIQFKNRYVKELYNGPCGPFGFRICSQYRLVLKRVSETVLRSAYRSTC